MIPKTRRSSVLVVDDNAEIRDLLRLLFQFDDFDVIEASNGPEALACVLRQVPEFIVLDYTMSDMTGDKVAPILRSLAPDTRIVAFSASLENKPNWADAFLNKERISQVSGFLTALLPSAGIT